MHTKIVKKEERHFYFQVDRLTHGITRVVCLHDCPSFTPSPGARGKLPPVLPAGLTAKLGWLFCHRHRHFREEVRVFMAAIQKPFGFWRGRENEAVCVLVPASGVVSE